MPSAVALIPAYQAAATIAAVLDDWARVWRERGVDAPRVIVVDDGSTDDTAGVAARAGAEVVRHAKNLGKGAALRSGLGRARELGADVAVALDADGQHPAAEAMRLLDHEAGVSALVLGIRNLVEAGAPRANRFSNAFSNVWLSGFSGHWLRDTQCGLRRYPVRETLALGARANGYGFEAEVILRAARAGWRIEQVPVTVVYPPESLRTTHFHSVRDPFRIVMRVLYTAATASRQ